MGPTSKWRQLSSGRRNLSKVINTYVLDMGIVDGNTRSAVPIAVLSGYNQLWLEDGILRAPDRGPDNDECFGG